jgi:hypothetical protein
MTFLRPTHVADHRGDHTGDHRGDLDAGVIPSFNIYVVSTTDQWFFNTYQMGLGIFDLMLSLLN